MRFWLRELAGWALVLLGVAVFYVCILFLLGPSHSILEAPTLAFIGFILFRGGLQLLKVATAARLAARAQEQVAGGRPAVPRPVVRRNGP
jgi:hypothetical protein